MLSPMTISTAKQVQIAVGSTAAVGGVVVFLTVSALAGWVLVFVGLAVAIATDSVVVRLGGAFLASLVFAALVHQGPPETTDNQNEDRPMKDGPATTMVQVQVIADDFGEAWPLTVPRGYLRCEHPTAVSFERMDGTIYRVNGLATQYPSIEPIWAKDPAAEPGIDLRKSVGPLIEMGLELCKQLK